MNLGPKIRPQQVRMDDLPFFNSKNGAIQKKHPNSPRSWQVELFVLAGELIFCSPCPGHHEATLDG